MDRNEKSLGNVIADGFESGVLQQSPVNGAPRSCRLSVPMINGHGAVLFADRAALCEGYLARYAPVERAVVDLALFEHEHDGIDRLHDVSREWLVSAQPAGFVEEEKMKSPWRPVLTALATVARGGAETGAQFLRIAERAPTNSGRKGPAVRRPGGLKPEDVGSEEGWGHVRAEFDAGRHNPLLARLFLYAWHAILGIVPADRVQHDKPIYEALRTLIVAWRDPPAHGTCAFGLGTQRLKDLADALFACRIVGVGRSGRRERLEMHAFTSLPGWPIVFAPFRGGQRVRLVLIEESLGKALTDEQAAAVRETYRLATLCADLLLDPLRATRSQRAEPRFGWHVFRHLKTRTHTRLPPRPDEPELLKARRWMTERFVDGDTEKTIASLLEKARARRTSTSPDTLPSCALCRREGPAR